MFDLVPRKIKHIIEDEFTDTKPVELHLSIFRFKDGSTVDIGAICYKRTKFKQGTVNSVRLTDLSTLDRRRSIFIAALIDYLRERPEKKPSSKIVFTLKILKYISWINEQPYDTDFSSIKDVRRSYEEYTKWLYHRLKLKTGAPDKLTNNSASQEQKVARLACSLMTNENIKVIEFWTTAIRHSDRELFSETLTNNPITDEDKRKTYSALCDFIHQAWSIWIKKDIEFIEINKCRVFSASDIFNQYTKNELYNKTIVFALFSFIGATGANLQVAMNATLESFDFGQSKKNARMSGTKYRARNKVVYPEFATKYLTIWLKWLDIRNAWLSSHNINSDFAFPYLGQGDLIKPIPNYLIDTTKPAAIFLMHFYGCKWISARQWRDFKSKLLGKASNNDVFISAEMQGHSVKTAISHYTKTSLIDAAIEISTALESIYDSAIARTRSKSFIPVTIASHNDRKLDTEIGSCQSEKELSPSIANGFTKFAPQPNCSIKETCLFCEKYAVHADEEDIRKLLSFTFVVNELSKAKPHADCVGRLGSVSTQSRRNP
ncbi:hypothetical protein [Comamonas testosteroni]|uniref:hypothetical protein n=1 Tax=Comamonas testosteroni TaxID=285 RepID=UPI002DC03964|nr:hypothetical protein [Comamonas testosteroni]MEB5967359.1 hypothetical protein [Comamonas testosteroni]